MIAADTNLLVYAHRTGAAEHRAARRAIERASKDPRGWGFALASVAEFWSIVTHPASSGGASSPKLAGGFLEALEEGGASVFSPRERFSSRLAEWADRLRVQGPRIFDLQIALMAFDGGATEIWTHDRRFVSLPGLAVHDPL